jgi:hypothetical protein
LPAGNWIDLWTNNRRAGGQNITWKNTNQEQFPLFVREGAIVPMLLTEPLTLCDTNYVNYPKAKTSANNLLLLIYPSSISSFTVYDGTDIQCRIDSGNTVVTLSCIPYWVKFQVPGDGPAGVTRMPQCKQNSPQ